MGIGVIDYLGQNSGSDLGVRIPLGVGLILLGLLVGITVKEDSPSLEKISRMTRTELVREVFGKPPTTQAVIVGSGLILTGALILAKKV